MRILVTGASGFIGRAIFRKLSSSVFEVTGQIRSAESSYSKESNYVSINISSSTDWSKILQNIDCIIHCAAIPENAELDELYDVNVHGTINLAEQALKMGVKRFIFISSIKVNGEISNYKPFRHDDMPNPQDNYANSKLAAETALSKMQGFSDFVTIVRSPMVYGDGAKGNLAFLLKLIKYKIPLPLKGIQNKRSFISIDNFVWFILLIIEIPKTIGEIVLISDHKDYSTEEFIRMICIEKKLKPKFFYFPIRIIYLLGKLFGISRKIDSLYGSSIIDLSYTRKLLGINFKN